MTQLYIIAQEYKDAADKLADLDLDAQTVADTLEGISGDFDKKAIATAMLLKNMSSFAAQMKEAEEAISRRRKPYEARIEIIENYLHDCMKHAGKNLIECPYLAIKIKKNPESVVIENEELLPAKFMTNPDPPKPAPNKIEIKKALQSGSEVPGARLQQLTRVEIK